jgi:nitrous oxidase accessory protein NosD
MEDSRIENNLFGLRFNTTDFLIKNNLLRSNGTAIRFHFGAPVIRNNVITDNEKGVFITSYPEGYVIEGNNIFDNRSYAVVLGEEVPDDVRMAGNYWGTDTPEMIAASLFDGRKDDYLGKVLFTPFVGKPFLAIGTTWVP